MKLSKEETHKVETAEDLHKAVDHIPSSVYFPEEEMWFRRLRSLEGNPIIVDFGCGHGRSASALALACPQGHVYTFDTGKPYINDGCSPEQYDAETRKFIADSGATNVTFTRENSLEKEWDREIDVLNDDSDHTYPTTKAEIERWVPFVKKGGLVFLHDWEHVRCPGVKQAMTEYLEEHKNLELLEVTEWSGGVKCACFKKL